MELSSTSQTPTNNTEFDLTPEQSLFVKCQKRFVGYVSGVGAGKTFAGIGRAVRNMQHWNPGEMGAIVAPTRTMVQDVIISEMRDIGIFDGSGYEFKSTYSEEPGIHAPNGSRALILSADNRQTVERLKGLNLAWWWMDEEAEIDPRAREILMQRLRTGEYRNGFITTTPKGKNHTYEFFVDDDAETYTHGAGTVYEQSDRLAITGVPTWANPNTPEDYHESMGADMPDQIRAQEVEGQFVEIGSGLFTTEMFKFAGVDDLSDKPYNWVIGVDVGVEADASKARQDDSDFWAAALLMVDKATSTAYLVDVARERGLTLKQGVSWVSKIADLGDERTKPKIFVESNQSQRWLKQELSDHGLNAYAVMNQTKKEERLIQMSIPLERGDVKFLNQQIDESVGYDPRFQPLISELLAFPNGSHDDMADALQIAIDNADFGGGSILGANPYTEGE